MWNIIKRRLFELFTTSILLSIAIVLIFEIFAVFETNQYNLAIACVIAAGIFTVINTRQLYRCLVDMIKLKRFYFCNLIAYCIYSLVTLILAFFTPVELFSSLFAIMKVFRYIYTYISYRQSAIMFHILMFIIILIAPFIMPPRYKEKLINHMARREQYKAQKAATNK